MSGLVLSLFPGIGLLDMAFEEVGFCVVRGPDLLWGGDIRHFHPPAGRFDGIIGGPPCQAFSRAAANARSGRQTLAPNLISEFVRVIEQAQPAWWLMENVVESPYVIAKPYFSHRIIFDNRDAGGEQRRKRVFTFGDKRGARVAPEYVAPPPQIAPTVTGNGTKWDPVKKRSYSDRSAANLREAIRLQGLPESFALPAFTVAGALKAVGNGVPLPMGLAIAHAVVRAIDERGAA